MQYVAQYAVKKIQSIYEHKAKWIQLQKGEVSLTFKACIPDLYSCLPLLQTWSTVTGFN